MMEFLKRLGTAIVDVQVAALCVKGYVASLSQVTLEVMNTPYKFCSCCGAEGPKVGLRQLMSKEHPVCEDCFMIWYDYGITDPVKLKEEVERFRERKTLWL